MNNSTLPHLEAIASILLDFLKENKGYSNGYATYVKGIVEINTYSRLEWSTPYKDELTGKEVKARGLALYGKVHKYMEDNNLTSALIITNRHIEWGCFKTQLSFAAPEYTLPLSDLVILKTPLINST